MSEISNQIAEFFNKHLPEDIKAKAKHLFSGLKKESKEETEKEFTEVKLKAEAFIKDNKDTAKVAEVKLALESKDLAQLKVLLAEEAPATESYNEAPLADGTILKYTGDLAVGAKCLLVTPEGEVPAPEGEHKLADGSTIVIAKEGEDSVISEIKPAEEMKTATTPAQMEAMIEKAVNTKFEYLKKESVKEIKMLTAKLEAAEFKLAKKSRQLNDLGTVVEAMASIGTGEPINKEVKKPTRISPPIVKARF